MNKEVRDKLEKKIENWKDDKKKSSALLDTWGIDEDTIDKYRGTL